MRRRQTAALTDGVDKGPVGYEGTAEWRPNIPDYGFYRVVVKMVSSQSAEGDADAERKLDTREVWLAVVPPLARCRAAANSAGRCRTATSRCRFRI